jgi:hypothetical protein
MKVDLGNEETDMMPDAPVSRENKKWYPNVYIRDNPAFEGVKIGDKISMTGEVKSIETHEHEGGKKCHSVTIDIVEADLPEGKAKKSMSKVQSSSKDEEEVEKGLQSIENDGEKE